jgi:hypothetical protein
MIKTWLKYLIFIGTYISIFLFLEAIPIEIDFVLAMVIGAIGMLLTLIYITRQKDFNVDNFYKVNLIFVILFCGSTIIYNKTFGLTDIQTIGNSTYFKNSKFYEWTLSTNHAILISTLLLIGHVAFTKNWKSSPIVISTILGLFLYLWIIV